MRPYVVTLNYGFEWNGDLPVFWFHCAKEGRKIDLIRKNAAACVSVDVDHELIKGDKGCDWSMKYRSVVAEGEVEIVEDPAEQKRGMDVVMERYAGRTAGSPTTSGPQGDGLLRMRVSPFQANRSITVIAVRKSVNLS
jgi:nitroimidazol reductase NimA-like FMN-containing flavoprotein (pyridoxamine 5'-phosphate oxidase superfamily)